MTSWNLPPGIQDPGDDPDHIPVQMTLPELRMGTFRKLIREMYPLDHALHIDLATIFISTMLEPWDRYIVLSGAGDLPQDVSAFPAHTKEEGEELLKVLARNLVDLERPLAIVDVDLCQWWIYDLDISEVAHGQLGKPTEFTWRDRDVPSE